MLVIYVGDKVVRPFDNISPSDLEGNGSWTEGYRLRDGRVYYYCCVNLSQRQYDRFLYLYNNVRWYKRLFAFFKRLIGGL